MVGRSPFMQSVHLDAPAELHGRLVRVQVDAAHPNSLAGHLARNLSGEAATPAADPLANRPETLAEARA